MQIKIFLEGTYGKLNIFGCQKVMSKNVLLALFNN